MPRVNLGKSPVQLQIEQDIRDTFVDEKKAKRSQFVSLSQLIAYLGKDRATVRKLMADIPAYHLDQRSISYRIDQAAAVISRTVS